MTLVQHRAEGLADTTTLTTSNTSGPAGTAFNAVVSTVTASTTHAAHGTRSTKYASSAVSTCSGQDTSTLGTLTVVRGREYVWIDGAPPANLRIGQADSAGALACGVGMSTGRLLRLNDSTSTQMAIGTVAIPTGQWVRIEWRMVASATVGSASAKVWFSADSTGSPDDSISSAASFNTKASFDRYQLGNMFSANQTYTRYGDEGAWSDVDAEIGPYVDPVTVTADLEGGSPLAPFDSTSGTSTSAAAALVGAAGVVLDSRSAASYVRVGPTSTGPGRRWVTLNAWMRLPSGTLTENAPIIRFRNTDPLTSSGGGNGDIWVDHTDQSVRGDLLPADAFASSASLIAANTWFLVQAVCAFKDDGTSSLKAKINGTQVGSITSTVPTVGEALQHIDIGSPSTADSILHVDQIVVRVSDSTLDYLPVTTTVGFDTVTATDTTAQAVAASRASADTTTVTDTATATIGAARPAADTVTPSDSPAGASASPRSLDDTLTVGDSIARLTALVRSTSDSVSASDAVTTVSGGGPMPLRINTAARNAACDAVVDLVDGGSGAGMIRIYSGSQPATPATSPSGTLLAEFTCSDPAFGSASTGVATLDITPALTDTGITDGTAGWFRILDSTEAAGTGLGIIDGSVTATGGGGQLTLNSTSIATGVNVEITSGTVTMPAS